MDKRKGTNNDIQNITQKTKNSCAPEAEAVPVPHVAPVVLI